MAKSQALWPVISPLIVTGDLRRLCLNSEFRYRLRLFSGGGTLVNRAMVTCKILSKDKGLRPYFSPILAISSLALSTASGICVAARI